MSFGANWQGGPNYATRKQLLSTTTGLVEDFKDYSFSTIQTSTLTVPFWISTAILYASTIKAGTIDISGFDISGQTVLYNGELNISTGNFSLLTASSLSFLNPDISGSLLDVDFELNLGLGSFLGGLVGNLGGLLAGGLGVVLGGVALGTSLAGVNTPRNNTYITQGQFETLNGTSQLQISTLGYDYPNYSTIYRFVSSTDEGKYFGMGVEIFTSTIFPAGSKCIRTMGDPINLPTAPTSSIQAFSQWVPFNEAQPDNIIANFITANNISSGLIYSGFLGTDVLGVASNVELAYQAPITFETGAYNNGRIVGNLNNFYIQSDTNIIFTKPDTTVEAASLYMGSNVNESILNISSINSLGDIKTVNFYASTITAEQLNVVSSFFLTSTNVEFITSTQVLVADNIFVQNAYIANFASSFTFATGVGNSNGPYDINKNFSLFSTSYDGISSITNNILNYQLNLAIQDEASFPLGPVGQGGLGNVYKPTPANVSQWASTIITYSDYSAIGQIDLGVHTQWAVTPGLPDLTGGLAISGATFDVYASNVPGSILNTLYITENTQASYPAGTSTFVQTPTPVSNVAFAYRFTLPPAVAGSNSGWWTYEVGFVPYETQNNNTFSITQDINDVWIKTTDRLNFEAGDINFDGQITLTSLNCDSITSDIFSAQQASVSTFTAEDQASIITFTPPINVPQIIMPNSTWGPTAVPPNLIEVDYNVSIGYVSSLASTNTQIMNDAGAGFINSYTSYISTVVERPVLNLTFGTANTLYLGPYGATGFNTAYNRPDLNWAKGTINFTAPDGLTIVMSNYAATESAYVLNLSNQSAFTASLSIQGLASSTLAAGAGISIFWNNTAFLTPVSLQPWAPYTITDTFQINHFYQNVALQSPNIAFTGNQSVTGTLQVVGNSQLQGQITTSVPSAGFAAIEIVAYTDAPSWSFVGGSGASWESAAQNLIPRTSGGYYKSSDWNAVVSVRSFTTPDTSTQQNSWAAYTVNQIVGGDLYLALYRYLVIIHVGPPSPGTFDVIITLYPKNFTTNT